MGSGISLDLQAEKIRGYAKLHDLELVEVVTDAGLSAKSLDRPGLTHALARLRSGDADTLVVFKLDRLTRNLGDWSSLIDGYFGERGGKSLASVSESIDTATAGGRMVLNLLMTVAQWERETIVERTRSAMAHKRSKNEQLGQVPFGYKLGPDGKTLEPCPEDRRVYEMVAALRGVGRTYRQIAELLNKGDVPAKRGGRWSHSSVGALLRRFSEANP